MNNKYLYILFFIFSSCSFSSREDKFIPDASFYNAWNESTKIELKSCCTNEKLKPFIEEKVKRLFRYRKRLFENIIKEFPQETEYFIEEYYSEGNEFSVHRMIVSTREFGKEASINYKGEIRIDTLKLKPLPLIQVNSSNCCPYSIEEYGKFDGFLPLKCITLGEVKKDSNVFRIQLSID